MEVFKSATCLLYGITMAVQVNIQVHPRVPAFERPRTDYRGGIMEHQRFEGDRTLMRIHIGESDKWHGKVLYEAIVELLRKESFYGATVLRGVAGYGSSSRYHTTKVL